MNNSNFLSCIPWLALGLLLCIPGCGKDDAAPVDSDPGKERYNVLLISLDTLRADHLGAYGYKRDVSPMIDMLAEKAVRFERAYSHAPWTTPSHAAMLTSLYPTAMGLKKYPDTGVIADRVETMAEYFKAQGYLTQAVTEGGMVHAQFGFGQGFDYYFQSARHVDHGVEHAIQWLDKYGEHPFFFFFHTYDIHRYDPPEEYEKRFAAPHEHRLAATEELARKIQSYDNGAFVESLDEADMQYIVDLYDASILWVDHYVSVLLNYLDDRGLLDRTIVVLTSDHGEEFLERHRTGHGYSNYEEQIHVPLIIYHPDVTPGVRTTLFRHIDVLPTMADALGLPLRREWLGESLWPTVRDGDQPGKAGRMLNYCECGHSDYTSIQSLEWKLIDNKAPKQVRLYNLEQDPGERQDVAANHPEVKRSMKHVLDQIESLNKKLSPRFAGEGIGMDELPEELLEQLQQFGYTK